MPIEIRVLTGARSGHVERFDKAVIVIGRHSASDLRFDPNHDLDVSGRHAEIRETEGKFTIRDTGSTNGTFLNGERLQQGQDVELHEGDKIRFGPKGPEAQVRMQLAKRSTEQRIQIAVSQQTAGIKRYTIGAIVLLAVAAFGAYWVGQRNSAQRIEMLRKTLEENDRKVATLQGGMSSSGDTALVNELQRRTRALRERLAAATTDEEKERIRSEIAELEKQSSKMIQMDLPAINEANAPAVALIVAEIGGKSFAGSGFAIAPQGVIMTNRHNVLNDNGEHASRVAVKFRDSGEWLPARVLKVSGEEEGDLALIQIDVAGKALPIVSGIQAANEPEGAAVALIGFPLGYSIAMEGEGPNFVARTTLNSGTVSKRTSTILQIDSFAAHGSSGSPVLNARGNVVGVVYGGPVEGAGRIVYAVPADKIAAFIPAEYRSIVRD
jgi:pSer/pThr/pTyr-binding forkhead associated (FHA) protein